MPALSRFYGIIIRMYFLPKEHNHPMFMQFMEKKRFLSPLKILKL